VIPFDFAQSRPWWLCERITSYTIGTYVSPGRLAALQHGTGTGFARRVWTHGRASHASPWTYLALICILRAGPPSLCGQAVSPLRPEAIMTSLRRQKRLLHGLAGKTTWRSRKEEKRRFSGGDRCLLHSRAADASDPAGVRNVLRRRFMGGRTSDRS